MPDMILVTICCDGQERDFELPSNRPFSQWEESLRIALKQGFAGLMFSKKELRLYWDGHRIQEDETLQQWGIWDGSRLYLIAA